MKRIATRARYLSIIIVFFIFCGFVFLNDYRGSYAKWVTHPSNKNIYYNGELAVKGNIYSSDDVKLLTIDNNGLTYHDDLSIRKATLHVIGDRNDNIVTGVLSSKRTSLIGYSLINGVYGAKEDEHNIQLTINASLSSRAYQYLNGYKGSIVVYNYKTGEIITMVSTPTFDPNATADVENKANDGIYINRTTNGLFVPGSIMKLVTSYAAVETIDNLFEQTFQCNHGTYIDGEWIQCSGNHGSLNFKEALAYSCNAAFAEISTQLGKGKLAEYVKKSGILNSYDISGVSSTRSIFDISNVNNAELAWAGIGQYTTMLNPMSFLVYMGAIANEGTAVIPYYIQEDSSIISSISTSLKQEKLISTDTANTLKELMRNNTTINYGDGNFSGMNLCAKTGTAQLEEGNPHSWFSGFLDNEDNPYAFVIIVENGAGVNPAITIAQSFLKEVINAK